MSSYRAGSVASTARSTNGSALPIRSPNNVKPPEESKRAAGSVAGTARSTNGSALPIRSPNNVKSSRRAVFRAPKTVQEKVLCYALCLIFIAMMVFLVTLCIVVDRWKEYLSKFSYSYVEEDIVCNTDACKETAQKLLSNLDTSTDPCEDFYQYACGGWIDKNPIPEDEPQIRASDVRHEEVDVLEKELLDDLDTNLTEPKALVSLRNLFQGCMNTEARNVTGVAPLQKLLKGVGGWPMVEGESWDGSDYSWYKYTAVARRDLDVSVFLEINLGTSYDSDAYELEMLKGDFVFYEEAYDALLQDPHSNESHRIVDVIVHRAQRLGSKMETDKLRSEARKLILFEYGLFLIDKSLEESKDIPLKELDENSTKTVERDTKFSYKELLNLIIRSDAPIDDTTTIHNGHLKYLLGLPSYIDLVQPRQIADYIAYSVLISFHYYTVENFDPQLYEYEDVDEEEDDSMWLSLECKATAERFMEPALFRLFAYKHFSPIAQYHVNKMVDMIRLAYTSTLDQTTWMDKKTMLYSLVKMNSMGSHVGFSWILDDELLDEYYQQVLDIREDDYFGAILKLSALKGEKMFGKWNKKVVKLNKILEDISPLEVNAFYVPWENDIVIPAGILGYPYYKFGRIDSINYGALGTIIGHEISHAFDANGRLYDHEGNKINWWTQEAEELFLAKAQCFVDQYHVNISDIQIDGNQTLSENIADNGGLRNAFKAFRLHLALSDGDMTHRKVLPGLPATPEQLFFLGFAATRCCNVTEYLAKRMSEIDNHSPNKLRVNFPLSNFKEFARAYECKPGTPMNPRHKCELW